MSDNMLKDLLSDDNWPWEERARKELNETAQAEERLREFRARVIEYSKKHRNFRAQIDDEFLMAFLRTRKFHVQKAMNCYCKYYKIRLCNPQKLCPVGKGPRDFRRCFENPLATILERRNPSDGTVVFIWSFRNFDLEQDELEEMFNASLMAAMRMILEPSVQTYGCRCLFDYTGITYGILASILGKFYCTKALLMAHGCLPMRFKGFHIINGTAWTTKVIYQTSRPLLPRKVRDRLYFHETNEDLHKFISPSILPDIFGGTAGPWQGIRLQKSMDGIHDDIVQKSYFGFLDF